MDCNERNNTVLVVEDDADIREVLRFNLSRSGFNVVPVGLNLVGLKRAGFTREEITSLKKAYVILYRLGLKLEDALKRIEKDVPSEHTLHLVRFIRRSKRGICRE